MELLQRVRSPSGYGSSGGIKKGSAHLQDTDQVVELGKGMLISRSGLNSGTVEREYSPLGSG